MLPAQRSCRYNCGSNLGSCSCSSSCQRYGNCCYDYSCKCFQLWLTVHHYSNFRDNGWKFVLSQLIMYKCEHCIMQNYTTASNVDVMQRRGILPDLCCFRRWRERMVFAMDLFCVLLFGGVDEFWVLLTNIVTCFHRFFSQVHQGTDTFDFFWQNKSTQTCLHIVYMHKISSNGVMFLEINCFSCSQTLWLIIV